MNKKILLSFAIFMVVFALASVVKINAAPNITGWLLGGGAEPDGAFPWDGTNTNVGWISMSGTTTDGSATPYGVEIPEGDGAVKGYAWIGGTTDSASLADAQGYLDFEPNVNCGVAYAAASCTAPDGSSGGVVRNGDSLEGWARFVEIAKATATGNSGGWTGWVSMSGTALNGSPYGVDILKMDGTGSNPTYAWSGGETGNELGWIDFSRAKLTSTTKPSISLSGPIYAVLTESSPTSADADLDWGVTDATSCTASGDWNWTSAAITNPDNGIETVTVSFPSGTYTLNCEGPGGSADPKTKTVLTGCYQSSCVSGSCTATIKPANNFTDCVNTCTSDSQCTSRNTGGYIEVY